MRGTDDGGAGEPRIGGVAELIGTAAAATAAAMATLLQDRSLASWRDDDVEPDRQCRRSTILRNVLRTADSWLEQEFTGVRPAA